MKVLFIVICLLLLSCMSFSQTLSEGAVVQLLVLTNPLNTTLTYDFEICCGIPSGDGGYLGNGFSYDNGHFSALYKFPNQTEGYVLSASIQTWYTPQTISKYCNVQSAVLSNATITAPNGKVTNNLVGEYIQLFCQRAGVYWLAGGGLTVHAQ